MMDHFSDLPFVRLIKITIQEEPQNGLPHLELNLTDIIQKMEDMLDNLSDHQLDIPTKQ